MDGQAVREILESARPEITNLEGYNYLKHRNGFTLVKPPKLETINCFSLNQIINLIREFVSVDDSKLIVNVTNYHEVFTILAKPNPVHEYNCLAATIFSLSADQFGKRMSQEDFIIELMTKFEDTPEREELLRLVSMIKSEKVSTSDDDGYSQTAGVRAGVTLVTERKVKNLWMLKTFKTFPEISQPEIPYILRLHQRGEETPQFALYDCDGGQWKVQVTLAVREFLKNRLNTELGDKALQVTVL